MTREHSIIELGAWLASPAGQCLLAWEQEVLGQALVDVFGFHALQVGLPELDALRVNRMPNRWLSASSARAWRPSGTLPPDDCLDELRGPGGPSLCCEAEALPFADQSLDLVVLPHTLELAQDPHRALAEVARVLRPEGRVVITGFNPMSLWSLRSRMGMFRQAVGWGGNPPFLPRACEHLGYWRLRDWLRLLSLEPEGAQFGCYRVPCRSERWLNRWSVLESVGERWWPVLGAVYMVQAVKRVRGMRLVGLSPGRSGKVRAPAAVALGRRPVARVSPGDNRPHD